MSEAQGMKDLGAKMSRSQSNEKVYRLPGDKTWEYLVKDGEWMTRKIGSQSLIPIMSLSRDQQAEALQKLDPLLFDQKPISFISPEEVREDQIPITFISREEAGDRKIPIPIPNAIIGAEGLTPEEERLLLNENETEQIRSFIRDASSKPVLGGFERSEGDEKVFTLFDSSDPYEYLVVDGEWAARKKGGESIKPLSGLPLDKQLEAVTKLDSNFEDARSGEEKAKSIESISNMLLRLPEGDPTAERIAAMRN